MTFDTSKLKATLQRELDGFIKAAEDLRVQASLARAELRTEWDGIEKRLHAAQEEINRLTEHAKPPLHEMEVAARKLLDELKHSLERLRQNQHP